MASKSPRGYSEEIMVAQPVDTIPLAAHASALDTMSNEPASGTKETEHMDIMSDTFLSEDSPNKNQDRGEDADHGEDDAAAHPRARAVRGRDRSLTPRTFLTPRTSPSPTLRTRKVNSRNSSLKRSSSAPLSIPTVPRRGRAVVSDAEMWGGLRTAGTPQS